MNRRDKKGGAPVATPERRPTSLVAAAAATNTITAPPSYEVLARPREEGGVTHTDQLQWVEWLLSHGMHLHPLDHPALPECIGRHGPKNPCDGTRGKHPATRWRREATDDPTVVRQWFSAGPRNIGISCGPSRLIVVDEDQPGALTGYAASIGETIPGTLVVTTAKGNHYYFRQPEGVTLGNATGALRGRGIDIRGDGGYVVGPGSLHETGVLYLPVDPDAPILPAPAWLVEALTPKPPAERLPLDRPTGDTRLQKAHTPELAAALARRTGDRSADIAAVWGAAYRSGWTVDEIVDLVIRQQHPICGKWGADRIREDAQRFYAKADPPYRLQGHDPRDPSDLVGGVAGGVAGEHSGAGAAGEHDDAGDTGETEWWRPIAAKYEPLDWERLWAEVPDKIEWLVDDLIERGQSIVIYSPPKTGKSLITLEIAAALATGRGVFGGEPREPMQVLYVDIENSPRDIKDRLSAMGYTPADLRNLSYLSFPSLPALDSPEGGRDLRAVAIAHGAQLVVIDTVSRVISGSENDADTFAALYRYALAPLKGDGVSVIRLDHSGKDLTLGQRGSSAKSADVDSVWLLLKTSERALRLRREASRTGRGAELIDLERRFEPLRHVRRGAGLVSAHVEEFIQLLDELGVPADAGRTRAREALEGAGRKVSTNTLAEVLRIRKARANLSNRDESDDQDHRTGQGSGSDHEGDEPVRGAVRRSSENRRSDLSGTVRGQGGQGAGAAGLDLSADCPVPKTGQSDRSVRRLFRTCARNGCRNPVPDRYGDSGHPLCSKCREGSA